MALLSLMCNKRDIGDGSVRAAGRFDDHIQDENDPCIRSVTILDGIRGWGDAGEEYIQLMDEAQEQVW